MLFCRQERASARTPQPCLRSGSRALPVTGALLFGMTISGCAIDMIAVPEDDALLIDDYIASLERAPLPSAGKTYGQPSPPAQDGEYSCVTRPVSETRQYDRLVAYAANSEALWPGALIAGRSLDTGDLVPVPFARAPLSFSVSLGNLQGQRSTTLTDPKLSTYRDALGEILSAELEGATAANLYSEIEAIHSAEQLALAIGVSASALGGFGGSGSFGLNWEREDIHSRFLVKYTQAYYTVDVDPPTYPSDFLDDSVTFDEVADRIAPDEPPLYVSSVTYGRTVLFTFESTHSSTELSAALDFAYKGGAEVSAELEAQYKEVLDTASIRAYILGGSGGEAARSIDSYEALMSFIKEGGNYSPDSPGAAIAYKLAFLADNQPARLALTEEYEERNCSRVSQRLRVVFSGIEVVSTDDGEGDVDVYGQVWAGAEDGEAVLFDRERGSNIQIPEGQTFPQSGSLGETILEVKPEPGQVVRLGTTLRDFDSNPFDGDDLLGDEVLEVPFESGWDRPVSLLLTGDGSVVKLHFSLEPI